MIRPLVMSPMSSDFGLPWMFGGMRGASPVTITPPATIADLKLDLDSRFGVTLVSGAVSAWADQSGTGNNASQATAANRPTYVVDDSKFGRRPSLSYDSTNDVLVVPHDTTLQIAAAGLTLYVVCAVPADATQESIVAKWAPAGGQRGYELLINVAGTVTWRVRNGAGTANYEATSVASVNGAAAHIIRCRYFSNTIGVRVDDNAEVTNSSQTGFRTTTTDLGIGGRANATEHAPGNIARVLIYQRFLNGTEDAQVMTTLREVYGL